MDSAGYHLFSHFWWLIFPLFWMVLGMARLWSRHTRANRALDLIKSYADQGKEPPAELLKSLQTPDPDCGQRRNRDLGTYGWIPFFLFAGLAVAFVFMGARDSWDEGHIFVAIIMGGLALGFLATMLAGQRGDRTPPQNDKPK